MSIKTNKVYLDTDVMYIVQNLKSAIRISEAQGNLDEVKKVVSFIQSLPRYYSTEVTKGYDDYIHSSEFADDCKKLKQILDNL